MSLLSQNDSMVLGKFQVHETISNLLNLITEFAPSSLSSRRESWSIGNSIILFGVLRLAPPIFCPSRYTTTTPLSQQLPKSSLPHLYKSFVYNLDSANNSYLLQHPLSIHTIVVRICFQHLALV